METMFKLNKLCFELFCHPHYSPQQACRDYSFVANLEEYSRVRDLDQVMKCLSKFKPILKAKTNSAMMRKCKKGKSTSSKGLLRTINKKCREIQKILKRTKTS
ncbi:uncharacterized protein LOC143202598 [Rhynchophorus ferrugineus]|uniref:uncharacterized protein LOC143202598 n=1 Tax=Rhynchophorus ferrugineus TaxID=354439 RepID=UPI003FCD6980